MPVALTGVRVSGSAQIARLPTPATDVRLPLQMLQAPRSKLLIGFRLQNIYAFYGVDLHVIWTIFLCQKSYRFSQRIFFAIVLCLYLAAVYIGIILSYRMLYKSSGILQKS